MDLAGDFDTRSSHSTIDEVRAMGEGRLIWGLVDNDAAWEGGSNPKPYPMAIITEFRLPTLGPSYNVYPAVTQTDAMSSDWQWRTQMERWGQLWRELSRYSHNSQDYKDLLWDIVFRFAKPENLVAIRANVELSQDSDPSNDEYELREWYRQRDGNMLPRRLREEIYPCPHRLERVQRHSSTSSGSAPRPTSTWTSSTPPTPRRPGCSATAFPATVTSTIADLDIDNMPDDADADFPGHTCPTDSSTNGEQGTMFDMWTSANPPQNTYSINGFNPPFARVRENDVHGGHPWENRRHAYAIRTCSGCHGKEAGVFGFHVAPRLAGENSALSTFIQGNGSTVEFSHGGNDYAYSAGKDREVWIDRAADRDPTMVQGETLYQDDRL